jgi:hypothetical protein
MECPGNNGDGESGTPARPEEGAAGSAHGHERDAHDTFSLTEFEAVMDEILTEGLDLFGG